MDIKSAVFIMFFVWMAIARPLWCSSYGMFSFVGWDAFADWHAFAGWNVFAFSGHGIIGFVDKDYKCLIENGCDERLENGHNSTSTLENRSWTSRSRQLSPTFQTKNKTCDSNVWVPPKSAPFETHSDNFQLTHINFQLKFLGQTSLKPPNIKR